MLTLNLSIIAATRETGKGAHSAHYTPHVLYTLCCLNSLPCWPGAGTPATLGPARGQQPPARRCACCPAGRRTPAAATPAPRLAATTRCRHPFRSTHRLRRPLWQPATAVAARRQRARSARQRQSCRRQSRWARQLCPSCSILTHESIWSKALASTVAGCNTRLPLSLLLVCLPLFIPVHGLAHSGLQNAQVKPSPG